MARLQLCLVLAGLTEQQGRLHCRVPDISGRLWKKDGGRNRVSRTKTVHVTWSGRNKLRNRLAQTLVSIRTRSTITGAHTERISDALLNTAPPADVKATDLYRALLNRNTPEDGLAERLAAFIAAATPLLDLILAGPFRTYTLHNPNHAKKLVHLAGYIISSQTLTLLTPLELTVIIMSCFLHDLGMCLTAEERTVILSSQEFEEQLRNWPQLWDDMEATRRGYEQASGVEKNLIETRLYQLQEVALANHLRSRHAAPERYRELMTMLTTATGRNDLFELAGVSFANELLAGC